MLGREEPCSRVTMVRSWHSSNVLSLSLSHTHTQSQWSGRGTPAMCSLTCEEEDTCVLLHDTNGQVVALQAVGPLLISGAQDGTMRIWDMGSPSTKDRMRLPPRDGPRCLYGLGVCGCMRERERVRRTVCARRIGRRHPSGPNPSAR